MASTSETGHAVNSANLKLVISHCQGLGDRYKPANPLITEESLVKYQGDIAAAVKTEQNLRTALMNAGNNLRALFVPIKPFCTRLMGALRSSGAGKDTIKNAKSVNKKIHGTHISTKETLPVEEPKPGEVQPKKISKSQQSFDQVMNNFSMLIEIIKAEPKYAPNEADLTVAAIEALYKSLMDANDLVLDSGREWLKALNERNEIMYLGKDNILVIAQAVKNYVKSVVSAKGVEYKNIRKIKFTGLKKK